MELYRNNEFNGEKYDLLNTNQYYWTWLWIAFWCWIFSGWGRRRWLGWISLKKYLCGFLLSQCLVLLLSCTLLFMSWFFICCYFFLHRLKFLILHLLVHSWRNWSLIPLLHRFFCFCTILMFMWFPHWFLMTRHYSSFLLTCKCFCQCDFDRLQLSTSSFMERNLEFMIECMEDLSAEQNKVPVFLFVPLFSFKL